MTSAETSPLLLIDSNHANRQRLAQQLADIGHSIALAESGQQGLQILRNGTFGLVLLGVSLPRTGSLYLLQHLKEDTALRHIPVIAVATPDEDGIVEQLIQAGADDYLLQPISPLLLQARLNVWMQQSSLNQTVLTAAKSLELRTYERELQIGQQIQGSFLPRNLPQPEGWEIEARFQPAREVAGDFYDAFTLTQNRRVGFLIGDVCGKGVGSALFMALFRSLLRAFARQRHTMSWADMLDDSADDADFPLPRRSKRQPALTMIGANALRSAVLMTNAYMIENHQKARMFATLFFGVLDPETGTLLYINGGHNPPILVRNGAINTQLEPTGPVVGIFPGADFDIAQVQLDPGDMLFCYTDGVTDAKDSAGTFFTEDHMFSLLAQPDYTATTLLDHMQEHVRNHMAHAPQFDDITMLAIRHKPEHQSVVIPDIRNLDLE